MGIHEKRIKDCIQDVQRNTHHHQAKDIPPQGDHDRPAPEPNCPINGNSSKGNPDAPENANDSLHNGHHATLDHRFHGPTDCVIVNGGFNLVEIVGCIVGQGKKDDDEQDPHNNGKDIEHNHSLAKVTATVQEIQMASAVRAVSDLVCKVVSVLDIFDKDSRWGFNIFIGFESDMGVGSASNHGVFFCCWSSPFFVEALPF
mmetsp:Transcript_11800/g.29915  ORF Transcript_11800/g.29915 Transcript_11800/m.29915 type:complete len:201 (-) Transcript_11800:48-650(-)